MKKYLVVSFLLCSTIGAVSQEKKKKPEASPDYPQVMVIPKNLFTPKNKDPFSKDKKDQVEQLIKLRQAAAQGSFSHSTPYGKVYSMRPSNMPCLVPDVSLNAPMPGSTPGPLPPSNMPNAQKPQKLIPDNK